VILYYNDYIICYYRFYEILFSPIHV
jgi:hypothetical protein